jgi:hypothetical protein
VEVVAVADKHFKRQNMHETVEVPRFAAVACHAAFAAEPQLVAFVDARRYPHRDFAPLLN